MKEPADFAMIRSPLSLFARCFAFDSEWLRFCSTATGLLGRTALGAKKDLLYHCAKSTSLSASHESTTDGLVPEAPLLEDRVALLNAIHPVKAILLLKPRFVALYGEMMSEVVVRG